MRLNNSLSPSFLKLNDASKTHRSGLIHVDGQGYYPAKGQEPAIQALQVLKENELSTWGQEALELLYKAAIAADTVGNFDLGIFTIKSEDASPTLVFQKKSGFQLKQDRVQCDLSTPNAETEWLEKMKPIIEGIEKQFRNLIKLNSVQAYVNALK
jgi:hypothetical protein